MTRFNCFTLGILISILSCPAVFQAEEIKIMTYNICNCLGLDGVKDLDRTASVIKKNNPDFVMIQELDQKTVRSKGLDILQELAKRTKMIGTFGKSIDFQGGAYGIGILSKVRPESVQTLPLPGQEEPRALLIAEFKKCYICCTHWSLREPDRLASAGIVTEKLQKLKKIVFLAGDFNAKPETPPAREMLKNWTCLSTDDNTWPSDAPQVRIDYIFAMDPVKDPAKNSDWLTSRLKESKVIEEKKASDHRPLQITLDLP